METKTVGFKLDEATSLTIDELAEKLGLSRSELVKRAVEQMAVLGDSKAVSGPEVLRAEQAVPSKHFSTPTNLYPPGQHPLGWNQVENFAAMRKGMEPLSRE